MSITYTPSAKRIHIDGYSEVTPCNFTDIHTAEIDTAHAVGWSEWHRIKTSSSYYANGAVAITNQPKPCEYGAINLYLHITVLTGTSFTLNVVGTDANGNVITVALTGINATGEYLIGNGAVGSQVAQAFKTVTSMSISDAVGFNPPSCVGADPACCSAPGSCVGGDPNCCIFYMGDPSCSHPTVCAMCGGIWTAKDCDNVQADCEACGGDWISNGVTFEIYQKRWGVLSRYGNAFQFVNGTILAVSTWFADTGKQITNGWFQYGTDPHIRFGTLVNSNKKTTADGCHLINTQFDHLYELQFFGCTANSPNDVSMMWITQLTAYNCIFQKYQPYYATLDYYNVMAYSTYITGCFQQVTGTFDKLDISRSRYGFGLMGSETLTITNVYARDVTDAIAYFFSEASGHINLIDADIDDWTFQYGTNAHNAKAYRQYTFNLKVTDKDANNINDVSVKIWDKDNTLIVDTTTASGVITEQTISRGYYNQANGNTLQDASPHTIEIKKAGYETIKHKFTMDKIIWVKRLKHSNICPDQEVML